MVASVEDLINQFEKIELENLVMAIEQSITTDKNLADSCCKNLFREIHSLKGTAGMSDYEALTRFIHIFEDALTVLTNNIRQVNQVKNRSIFDIFLYGLDVIENFINSEEPIVDSALVLDKKLYNYVEKGRIGCAKVRVFPDFFLEYSAIDEDLF